MTELAHLPATCEKCGSPMTHEHGLRNSNGSAGSGADAPYPGYWQRARCQDDTCGHIVDEPDAPSSKDL
jgi:hypothetical protein